METSRLQARLQYANAFTGLQLRSRSWREARGGADAQVGRCL